MTKTLPRDKHVFLLGLGAQKCGTSWLAKQLRTHPQFLISPIKELHYWDRRFHPDYFRPNGLVKKVAKLASENPKALLTDPLVERMLMERDERFYLNFFETRLTPAHRAFGEFSPSYCIMSTDELRYIRDFMPYHTKAIFMMRDPVARLWSQCKMEHLKARNRGRELDPVGAFKTALDKPKFYARSDYAATVQSIDAAFAPEDRHYEFFEELFTNDAITRIFDFVGIDPVTFDFSDNPNEGIKIARPSPEDWQRVHRKFEPIYDFIEKRFGRLPTGWRRPE